MPVSESDYHELLERDHSEQIERQSALFRENTMVREVLDAVPESYLVLNRRHQVIFANQSFASKTHRSVESLYGERFGEIVNCVYADVGPNGCGTAEACKPCGVVGPALEAMSGRDVVRDARLTLKDGRSVDVRVHAHKMAETSEPIILLSVSNTEHEQRRRVLERTFFHDILNTASGIQGLVGILHSDNPQDSLDLIAILDVATTQLVEEIKAQRTLLDAETGDLVVDRRKIDAGALIIELVGAYSSHGVAERRRIEIDLPVEEGVIEFESDPTLVRRILGNLIKNALEASRPGTSVRVGVVEGFDTVTFRVHNDTTIPKSDQLQIFQRSFSTKGMGRGIGTYSVRMFTEQYLGGQTSFTSTPEGGTTFSVVLPRSLEV